MQAGVQQIAGAVAMDGGNGYRVSKAKVVELVEIRVRQSGGIHLIHRQNDGLAAAQEHSGHLLIRRRQACPDIRQKHNDRGGVNGDPGLIPHKFQNQIIRPGFDAAGVHQGEAPAVPVAVAIDPVAGHAGGVLHNGQTPPDQLIEQHGLAYIGPSHNGHYRFCHNIPPKGRHSKKLRPFYNSKQGPPDHIRACPIVREKS